ncbi:putative 4'-phosphopantetheinyl transferase [Paractinoplanes deccanensis]|uniref:4'-phosphopantetheinyl transferase n=1 Tax=Paractinoplanes deccanensis TaxID=113561 RepID=A0ABQ3Y1A3_9ACTN|nr:4'-phosphopantetheinyl transferase superfamily protein [Actinoplanes deccanensis]GID73767.1 putative 4'-phosphopantetheinyl transferase [Actinoplanes deccanensis]
MTLIDIVPPEVVVVESFGDHPGEEPFPGEEHLIARAVEGRRREFITGRRNAREALGRLGFAPAPILTGPRREPLWPGGVVGSITHCRGYRAAAVALSRDVTSVGVDAEPHAALPPEVLPGVTLPVEREMLHTLDSGDTHWDRLLFSAKESIYKAWFPMTGRWLGFEDCVLSIDPPARTFAGRPLVDSPLPEFRGRYTIDRDLVFTAVTVTAAVTSGR